MITVLDPLPLSCVPRRTNQQCTSLKDVSAENVPQYLW
jgi:hypothetical protein